jgi:hypothetical protein
MNKAFGPRVVLVVGVALAAVPFRPDSLLAQSRRFTSGVELVPLTVTVTDRAGRYVPDLTAADFAIFEEGRRQPISHFAWRRTRHAASFNSSGRATERPSLASGRPFRSTSR